jgi:hypothetical protein
MVTHAGVAGCLGAVPALPPHTLTFGGDDGLPDSPDFVFVAVVAYRLASFSHELAVLYRRVTGE